MNLRVLLVDHVSKYVFDNNWHIKVLICTYFLVLLLLLAFYVAKKVFKKFHATYDRANLAHALYKAVLVSTESGLFVEQQFFVSF